MRAKPGTMKADDGTDVPLVVRHPDSRRPLRAEGEELPETGPHAAYWAARLRQGDIVLVEAEKIGELVADGAVHQATFDGDHPAEPADGATV